RIGAGHRRTGRGLVGAGDPADVTEGAGRPTRGTQAAAGDRLARVEPGRIGSPDPMNLDTPTTPEPPNDESADKPKTPLPKCPPFHPADLGRHLARDAALRWGLVVGVPAGLVLLGRSLLTFDT